MVNISGEFGFSENMEKKLKTKQDLGYMFAERAPIAVIFQLCIPLKLSILFARFLLSLTTMPTFRQLVSFWEPSLNPFSMLLLPIPRNHPSTRNFNHCFHCTLFFSSAYSYFFVNCLLCKGCHINGSLLFNDLGFKLITAKVFLTICIKLI